MSEIQIYWWKQGNTGNSIKKYIHAGYQSNSKITQNNNRKSSIN